MKRSSFAAGGVFLGFVLLLGLFFSGIKPGRIESYRILDRNGLVLREVSSTRDGCAYPVKTRELPVCFIKMLINTEDKRFYKHHGVDLYATARAFRQNLKARRVVSGGSTITQQLVRNLYGNPRTAGYKILESMKAILVETRYSKEKILEEYLNRIPYGNGAFGVEAAARLYFSKPARDLSPAQSAYLIAIPGATRIYNPYANPDSVLKRQKKILAKCYGRGAIDKKQFVYATDERISISPRRREFLAPHFCGMIIKEYGSSLRGAIRTTLDSAMQRDVEKILSNNISRLKKANVNNAAVIVMDNDTGGVLAYAGSVDYFDENSSGQINGAAILRQPGSSVKPFLYGMAIENGYTAADILRDLEIHVKVSNGMDFSPRNYDKKFHGPIRLRQALACSYNAATVYLADKFGPQRLLDKLHLAGLSSLKKKAAFYGPGLCLGNGEVSLLEMTSAYSALANNGMLKKPRVLFDEPAMDMTRVMSEQAVFIITDILSDNQARQPAFGDRSPLYLPFKCAAKTGTSKDFKDNWAIGYTPEYTVGVWAGNFNMEPMYNVSGISGAAPVWKDVMLLLRGKVRHRDFAPAPDGVITRSICPKSGFLPNDGCGAVMNEYFVEGSAPKEICRIHRTYIQRDENGPGKDSEKVYEVYPPEYQQWAEENGIAAPRGEIKPKTNKTAQQVCEVLYPHDGDVFRLDAVLRKEFQVITLKAGAPRDTRYVVWDIDGNTSRTNQYPFQLPLKLEKGEHVISLTAVGKKKIKSGEVRFKVL